MQFRAIAVITGIAAGVLMTTVVQAVFYAPQPPEVAALPSTGGAAGQAHPAPPGDYPARLSIPELGVFASVQYVGLTTRGTMGAPTNFIDVAWYRYGAVPGTRGSAVMAGHVDNGFSLPGVFKRIGELRAGSELFVETRGGERLRFVVTDVRSYPYEDVPSDVLFGRADMARLNLITCEGHWLAGEKTYDRRLVVFAELR